MNFLREWMKNRDATLMHGIPFILAPVVIFILMFIWGMKDPKTAITVGGIAAVVIVIAVLVVTQRR